MIKTDLQVIQEKFFSDPSWDLVEQLIREYITPLESSLNISTDMTNDQIATEVRGRQLAVKSLEDFLTQAGVLKPRVINKGVSFI